MSVEPIDLAAFAAWVSRPDASPAPTSDIPPRTGDNPVPSRIGPQHRPTVDELCTRAQRTVADLWAAIEQSQRARGADTELREVA